MAAVVVLPWAPPTTIDRRSETSSARNSARGRPSNRPEVRGRDDDLETRRRLRLAADVDGDSVERLHEDRLAEIPARAPPLPTRARCSRTRRDPLRRCRRSRSAGPPAGGRSPSSRASRGRESHELVSDLLRSARPGERAHRVTHSPQPLGIVEQLVHERRGSRASSSWRTTTAPPPRSKWTRVLRLVICRRVRVRHEDRRCPGGGELPDRPARARDRQIGSGERLAEPLVPSVAARSRSA